MSSNEAQVSPSSTGTTRPLSKHAAGGAIAAPASDLTSGHEHARVNVERRCCWRRRRLGRQRRPSRCGRRGGRGWWRSVAALWPSSAGSRRRRAVAAAAVARLGRAAGGTALAASGRPAGFLRGAGGVGRRRPALPSPAAGLCAAARSRRRTATGSGCSSGRLLRPATALPAAFLAGRPARVLRRSSGREAKDARGRRLLGFDALLLLGPPAHELGLLDGRPPIGLLLALDLRKRLGRAGGDGRPVEVLLRLDVGEGRRRGRRRERRPGDGRRRGERRRDPGRVAVRARGRASVSVRVGA